MTKPVKVLITKPDDVSSIPGPHTMGGENKLASGSPTSTWVPWLEHEHMHIHTINKCNKHVFFDS